MAPAPTTTLSSTTSASFSESVVLKGFAFVVGCALTLKGAIATFLTVQTQFFGLVALESGYVNPATHEQIQNLPIYFGWQYGVNLTVLLLGCMALMIALGRKNTCGYVLISSLIWTPVLIWAMSIVMDVLTPSLSGTSRFSEAHPTIVGAPLSEWKAIALLLINGLIIMAMVLLLGMNLALLAKARSERAASSPQQSARQQVGQRIRRHYKSLGFVAIATAVVLITTNPSQQRHFKALALRAQGISAETRAQISASQQQQIQARIDGYYQTHGYHSFLLFSVTQDQSQAKSFGILGSIYLHRPKMP